MNKKINKMKMETQIMLLNIWKLMLSQTNEPLCLTSILHVGLWPLKMIEGKTPKINK